MFDAEERSRRREIQPRQEAATEFSNLPWSSRWGKGQEGRGQGQVLLKWINPTKRDRR